MTMMTPPVTPSCPVTATTPCVWHLGLMACCLVLTACGGGSDDKGNTPSEAQQSPALISSERLLSCPGQAQSPLDFTQMSCMYGRMQGLGLIQGNPNMQLPCTVDIDATGVRIQIKDNPQRAHTVPPSPRAVTSYVRNNHSAGTDINLQVTLYADKEDLIVDGIHLGYQKATTPPGPHRFSVTSTKNGEEQSCALDF